MAEYEFTLTEEQQRIIDINEGIHLVLAPPGSGKTELLALRVEKAIKPPPAKQVDLVKR